MQINIVDFTAKNKCESTEIKQSIHYIMMYTALLIPVSAYPIKKEPTHVLFSIVDKPI